MESKTITMGPNASPKEVEDFCNELNNPNNKITNFTIEEDLINNKIPPFGSIWPYNFELLRFTLESAMEASHAQESKWNLSLVGTNNKTYELIIKCKLGKEFDIDINWFKVLIKMLKSIQPNIFKRIYYFAVVVLFIEHRERFKQILYEKFWNTFPSRLINEENKKAITSFYERTIKSKQ